MKMAPGLFWGVLLVLIGLAAIFRVVFDVNLFGVLFAFFLIFIGVSSVASAERNSCSAVWRGTKASVGFMLGPDPAGFKIIGRVRSSP